MIRILIGYLLGIILTAITCGIIIGSGKTQTDYQIERQAQGAVVFSILWFIFFPCVLIYFGYSLGRYFFGEK